LPLFLKDPLYGGCLVADLIRYLCQFGYSEEHAQFTARLLFDRKCCEAVEPSEKWTDSIKEIRITSRGRYHVAVLVNVFQYIDAMIVDTPILDNAFRAKIGDKTFIKDRLERCKIFLEYLNRCSIHLHDSRATQIWIECYSNVTKDINAVEANLAKRENAEYYPKES
jgi:hypothetical protein